MLIKVIHKNTANKISHLCQITPKMRFILYPKKKRTVTSDAADKH